MYNRRQALRLLLRLLPGRMLGDRKTWQLSCSHTRRRIHEEVDVSHAAESNDCVSGYAFTRFFLLQISRDIQRGGSLPEVEELSGQVATISVQEWLFIRRYPDVRPRTADGEY